LRPNGIAPAGPFAEDDDHLVVEVEGGEVHKGCKLVGPSGTRERSML
jgi:hypothetical protein